MCTNNNFVVKNFFLLLVIFCAPVSAYSDNNQNFTPISEGPLKALIMQNAQRNTVTVIDNISPAPVVPDAKPHLVEGPKVLSPAVPDAKPPLVEGPKVLSPVVPDAKPPLVEGPKVLSPAVPDAKPPLVEGPKVLSPVVPDAKPPLVEGPKVLSPAVPDAKPPLVEGPKEIHNAVQKHIEQTKHIEKDAAHDLKEEEIIIQEVILDTDLQERPIYDHKTITLSPNISKKNYSENNKHLPKVFYQSEYTELLFDAVKINDIQGIKSLIQKGANINAQEITNGYTPAMFAIKYNKIKALRSLILNGADIQKQNLHGQTALHLAAINSNAQAIEVLISAGINPAIKDNKGNRAADYMKTNVRNAAIVIAGNYQDKTKALIDFVGLSAYDAVNFALDNGAKINNRDDIGSDGDTALIIAIKCQDIKMISLLLNKGAGLHVRNKKGKSPMQVALEIKNNEIIAILQTVKINREMTGMTQ